LIQIVGIFYIIGFLSFVPQIHLLPQGPSLLLFLLLLIWGGDISAYYGGRTLGRHKLSPSISPGKTVEGGFVNTLFCLLLAIPVHFLLLPNFSLLAVAGIGVIISVTAQCGDLLESLIKRGAHVKDSGKIMPGHGGMLDRFDSLIFAAPVYYFLVKLLGN
jgi:phosphatidate cytidylyltransferase